MQMRLKGSTLSGKISSIPSKSDAHRCFICSALADKSSKLFLPQSSDDIDATIECLRALGSEIENSGYMYSVSPISSPAVSPLLDCGESGSTLRFLLPVAAAVANGSAFIGRGRLPKRPLAELVHVLELHSVSFSSSVLPFTISGNPTGGIYRIPGNISSQYITGLLLMLPMLDGKSCIELTSPLESSGYVDITLRRMKKFGVEIQTLENGYLCQAGQRYISPGTIEIEGDWSGASFFLAAGAICGNVTVTGLDPYSPQSDKAILDILKCFGADVSWQGDAVTVKKGFLTGTEVNMSEIPDLLPVLAVVGAAATGKTVLYGAGRTRLKESDRLSAVCNLLCCLGSSCTEEKDALVIDGGAPLHGGMVAGCGDHRIEMAASIASLLCRDGLTIDGAEAITKSYPTFFNDFRILGGNADVI